MAETVEIEGNYRRSEMLKTDLVWRKGDQRKKYRGALVGKLITEKFFNKATTIQMIRKGWNLDRKEDLEITDVDSNAFIFEFRRKEDYLRILRGRPWSIQGTLLNIQQWKEFMVYKEVDFDFTPMWIQFHDLPLEGMEVDNAVTLGSLIGEVVMVEEPRRDDLLIRRFLRARILVDVRKPLVTGMWTFKPDNEKIWIKARYERLQNFCYYCGRFGHDKRVCPHKNKEDNEQEEEEYGGWLSTQAARPILEAVRCIREGWEEYENSWKRKDKKGEETESLKILKKNPSNEEGRKEEKGKEKGKGEDTEVRQEGGVEIVSGGMEKENEAGSGSERETHEKEKKVVMIKKDISKAIVLYGTNSPLSEVMKGLKKVNLKRERKEEELTVSSKKRKLMFEEEQQLHAKKDIGNNLRRRSIRTLKKQGRKGMKNMDGGKAMMIDEVEVESLAVVLAEGFGGWPATATEKP